MKKELHIPTLLNKRHLYSSVTITPKDSNGVIEARFFMNEKTPKGKYKVRTEKYRFISGWGILPRISNEPVKHFGYTQYYSLVEKDFYINLYFTD